MGLGGAYALAGLGQGLQTSVAQILARRMEEQRLGVERDLKLAQMGYRPASDADISAANAPAPPHMTMLDPGIRSDLITSGVADAAGGSALQVTPNRPQLQTFGGHQYVYDPSRLLEFQGDLASAKYAPHAQAQLQAVTARGNIARMIAGDRDATQLQIAQGHDATSRANTTSRNQQSNTNNVRSNSARMTIHNTPGASQTGANSDSPLVHRGVFVGKQLADVNAELRQDNKVISDGLPRRATAADSARYQSAITDANALKQKADSLRSVLSNIGSQMTGTQPSAKTKVTQHQYEWITSPQNPNHLSAADAAQRYEVVK